MSTVPNDAVVQAAITALEPYAPTSPEQAADMLLFWVRRSEMTEADLAALQARMFPRRNRVSAYPLPHHPDDDRLDEDLVGLVADLIVFRTRYPLIDGPDLERLRQALGWFLYAEPIAEHYETRAWKGDGPGTCGIECACGVGYDGFDSLAEATQQLSWHIADPSGQDYGRADTAEQDDSTPAGHRVPPHTGGLTEAGWVDETASGRLGAEEAHAEALAMADEARAHAAWVVGEIRCSCGDAPDPNCRVHASRFRRPCEDPAPHGEHPWKSPAVLGAATWTCPGVLGTEGGAR